MYRVSVELCAMKIDTRERSITLILYFAITAFGLEALWLLIIEKSIIEKCHIASASQHPLRSRCWEDYTTFSFYEKNFAIIGACIGYLWTEYCICTMYIFIYLYNINTFHHIIFSNCQSYPELEKSRSNARSSAFLFAVFAIVVSCQSSRPNLLISLVLYPRMWLSI